VIIIARKNANKKQSFLNGAAILVGATAMVKIIGAIFKIPLSNLIGESGMGYFQTAYDLYLPIYSLAMAGLPVAVSKMVADSIARARFADARKLLNIARKAFLVTGLTGFFIMLAITYPYILITDNTVRCVPGLLAIAPSILFCCMMSSYRGYYEGLRNMTPTAVSQVIEAIGKLLLGLLLAFICKRIGLAVEYQAAAAIIGITVGSFFGALYLMLRHRLNGDGVTEIQLLESPEPEASSTLLKSLIKIAIPVVLGSLVVNVASLVDVTTVQSRLSGVVDGNLETLKEMYPQMLEDLIAEHGTLDEAIGNIPIYLYGCYKGYAYSVYNLIPTITSALGVSALPALASVWASGNKKGVKVNIESTLRITALISMPCGIGMTVLSTPIMHFLYPYRPTGAEISGPILAVLGFAAVFAGMAMPLTNMLQGIGKQNIPLRNIAVGAVLKIIFNYILVGIPEINIHGAPVGTAVCYGYIFVMNLYYLIKYSGVKVSLWSSVFKPLIAALLCGGAAFGTYMAVDTFTSLSLRISVVAAIVAAGFTYLVSVFLFRVLTKDDILMLPKGQKAVKVLEKLHWIG